MTKARFYRILIATASTVNMAMDIMQIAASDKAVSSDEFFTIYEDCKARVADIRKTPESVRA